MIDRKWRYSVGKSQKKAIRLKSNKNDLVILCFWQKKIKMLIPYTFVDISQKKIKMNFVNKTKTNLFMTHRWFCWDGNGKKNCYRNTRQWQQNDVLRTQHTNRKLLLLFDKIWEETTSEKRLKVKENGTKGQPPHWDVNVTKHVEYMEMAIEKRERTISMANISIMKPTLYDTQ